MSKRPWNGPWVFDRFYGEVFVESETEGRTSVAMVLLDRKGDEAGPLIAAAPELYEALELLVETVEAGEGTEAALNIARGALKEAGGAS